MTKKRKLDKLDLEMIQCEKDGYGVHYGRWKATQPKANPVPVELPTDWKVCPQCGKQFKPRTKQQKYCEANCCNEAQRIRGRQQRNAYMSEYRARKAEMGV